MIPYLHTPLGDLSSFALCVIFGILTMLLLVHAYLKRHANCIDEENFIFPKIIISGVVGYICSGFLDSLFKFRLYNQFKIAGITFYGGFLGAVITMFILLKWNEGKTAFSIKKWFDILTNPFVAFHIWGRIGCFLGGCCYGKITDSFLGVAFPDNAEAGIFHYGEKCLPTQLFEAFALALIYIAVYKSKNKFSNYVLLYSIARFIIEFFRGDERGFISTIFSPAQVISIVLFIMAIGYNFMQKRKKDIVPKKVSSK